MKYDYHQPPWMTKEVNRLLRESTRLTRHYCKNSQKIEEYEKVLKKAEDCTREIFKTKND